MSSPQDRLNEILSKILLVDSGEIHDDLSREGVEDWDSMTHLMLVSEVETAFDVALTDDDIMSINTVGDLRKILVRLGISL
jgi:acyl carrier protein